MIFAQPFGIQVETTGVTAQASAVTSGILDRLKDTWEAVVEAGGLRGAARNALIARAQANNRRDPWYINPKAMSDIRELAGSLTSQNLTVRVAAAKAIGSRLLMNIAENVQAQRNKDGGPFTPLTAAYARRKQQMEGFVRPILKATGDLLAGLHARVTRS